MPKLPNRESKRLLALDPSTKCGWAVKNAFGTWDLKPKRDESIGMRVVRFKAKLSEVIESLNIEIVVFERPGGRNTGAIITQSELQGVIKLYCEEKGVDYKAYSSSEIKKFATGKGNSGKPEMIKAAKDKYGYQGTDDNEADALHLYHLAKSDLNL